MHTHPLYPDLLQIWHAAIQRVQGNFAVEQALSWDGAQTVTVDDKSWPIASHCRLGVCALGKAAPTMAQAASAIFGDRLDSGFVITKDGHLAGTALPEQFITYEAAHPVPDQRGVAAAEALEAWAESFGEGDFVLVLISGGASALVPAPAPGLSLADKQRLTEYLLAAGAPIQDINFCRQLLSRLKGGGLLRKLRPAQTCTLALSDVEGDHPSLIGSGPTVPCTHSHKDIKQRIEQLRQRYGDLPVDLAAAGSQQPVQQQNQHDHPLSVIATNADACEAAAHKAQALGYSTSVSSTFANGSAEDHGKTWAQQLNAQQPGHCHIGGGETTVVLPHEHGLGGRNQQAALAAAIHCHDYTCLPSDHADLLLFAGTDGTDDPTDAAGAIVSATTLQYLEAHLQDGRSELSRCNAYDYLKRADSLFSPGPTGTNVMDLSIALTDRQGLARGSCSH